jgi:uncharacterized protein YcgI (DUF1989 family)
MQLGDCRFDLTLKPVSGKALPVRKGEVLRITQVQGDQCVDFNCFNLHDYKERMSVGHMRLQGFRVREGHIVVSAPPRYRPMMAITHMSETCVTDLLGSRCDATMGEREYDLVPRTNCQDTFAESIREFDLTPDDVHDSFNMWMNTCWGESYRILPNVGPAGDYVDLLALMDVLAVPIICGSGDLGQVSNFSFKPIQVQIFEASNQTHAASQAYLSRCKSERAPPHPSWEVQDQRELRCDANYRPSFKAAPLSHKDVQVEFSEQQLLSIRDMIGHLGNADGDLVRAAFMLWYRRHRMCRHWLDPNGPAAMS